MFRPNVIFPLYSSSNLSNNNIVMSILSNYPNHNTIYTDGSKSEKGSGCAFYHENKRFFKKMKLHDTSSIYTAEMYAIWQSLNYIKENNIGNAIIMSDSKSALQTLAAKNSIKHFKNTLAWNIKNVLQNLSQSEIKITFIWVQSHSGIKGNELVDLLAKDAVLQQNAEDFYNTADIIPILKKEIFYDWNRIWQEFAKTSHNPYVLIHSTLPNTITHIDEYSVSKGYSTIITRMKLNHGCFPAHLAKIGISNSSICNCNNESIADLNHLIFVCKNNQNEINTFMKTLIANNIPLPTNLTLLLSTNNKDIFDALVDLVRAAKILI